MKMNKVKSSTLPRVFSKEEILKTLDQFGDHTRNRHKGPQLKPNEDNNNLANEEENSGEAKNEDSELPSGASFAHSYSKEWDKLFTKPSFLKSLRKHGLGGELRSSRFRSICWKLYLEVLPEDLTLWVDKTKDWRAKYEDLKNTLIVNPRKAVDHADLTLNNPLSQVDESPWNRFFQDNELRLTIKQDVIRTYPRIEFFKSNQVRNMMVDALFIYAKLNPDISYRQGMHELLAPLIFILHCDHEAFLHACEIMSIHLITPPHREIVKEVMDPTFLEHDAYFMFCKVMETVEPWYISKDPSPTHHSKFQNKDIVNAQPFSRPQDFHPSNVIVTKLTRVQDYLLRRFDNELHQHLERLDIAPQIYGIRWVRLLFGREFPMQDLLVLWDAIFADGIGFDLVDYIFVAMLLYIRTLLITSDYPSCLNALMRYPPVGDVHFFVRKALYIREPNQQPMPPNYSHQSYNVMPARPAKEKKASTKLTNKLRASSVVSGLTSLTWKSRPRTLHVPFSQEKKMSKSSSEPMNLQTDVSPASTPLDEFRYLKRGSTASLSQVEDSVMRTSSPASLARMDLSSPRSINSSPGFTPDETSVYATLPRAKHKIGKISKKEQELEKQKIKLEEQLNEMNNLSRYCASKMDVHIDKLQNVLLDPSSNNEDEMFLALAGIKQVRDILKGTLRFSRSLMEEDGIKDSVDGFTDDFMLDVSETNAVKDVNPKQNHRKGKKKKFYMSSEENSETGDSQTSPVSETCPHDGEPMVTSQELELDDYQCRENKHNHKGGEQEMSVSESVLSSSSSERTPEDLEPSPNPLYQLDSFVLVGDED